MARPKPSEARVVVKHYEDGRMKVFVDGNPLPGVIEATIHQSGIDRSELKLSIIGVAFKLETSELNFHQDRGTSINTKA
ncbi:hypothetical protein [Brucella pseudogrignonensis]|uniref:Uncharacterized protein n=1 Tax=Brucella pseudogrignonensis TaxID=419475 RepID=A0ABU1M7K3_9HYPH|nr:hypothetical protein [Brucella pseudogrignonensis]MDR6432019.1 hypothetical protein [Brucella pseudogrignonensis]